jgi:peptidyl-prolyl cis-trans isomerase C
MKKTITIVALSLLFSSCATNKKNIIATYKGGSITIDEARSQLDKLINKNEQLKELKFENLDKDQKELVIKEVILQKLLYKEAKKQKLNNEQSYKTAVKNFKKDLLKQNLYKQIVNQAQSSENIEKNYNELIEKSKNKKDFKISYIAFSSKQQAENIHKKLAKNISNFATFAKKYSIDKDTGKKGGDIGFIFEDSLPSEVIAEVKILKNKKITKPLLVADSWFIIKLNQVRPAEILPFDKAKEQLTQNLGKNAVEDFIDNLIKQAEIKIINQ